MANAILDYLDQIVEARELAKQKAKKDNFRETFDIIQAELKKDNIKEIFEKMQDLKSYIYEAKYVIGEIENKIEDLENYYQTILE